MRYFDFLGFQHFVMYFLPAMAFIVLFITGLGYYHFHRESSQERLTRIIEKFPDGIEGRNAPFPLIIYLIIAGAVVWVFAYIMAIGASGIKI